jgi:hypothetical protein
LPRMSCKWSRCFSAAGSSLAMSWSAEQLRRDLAELGADGGVHLELHAAEHFVVVPALRPRHGPRCARHVHRGWGAV